MIGSGQDVMKGVILVNVFQESFKNCNVRISLSDRKVAIVCKWMGTQAAPVAIFFNHLYIHLRKYLKLSISMLI